MDWVVTRRILDTNPLKEGPIAIIKSTLRDKGITGLYSGCGALVVGNAAKAGVRFVSYDYFKNLLKDKDVSSMLECRHWDCRVHKFSCPGESQRS